MIFDRGIYRAVAVCAALCIASTAHATETLRLGHNRTWSNPALLLGLANGDFKRAGVTVVEHEFTNPADIITAIASGDLDAGAAPGPTVFTSVARGVKIKIVALLQGSNHPPISYMVRTDSGIKSPQDLRGKVAGVNNFGGNYDIYLRYWLAKNGLDPKKDVDITIVPVPAMLPALINKRVDVAPLAAFDRGTAEQRYPGQIRTLFDYNDVMKAGTGAADNNSIVLVMSDAFISHARPTAIAFLEGYLRAVHAMNRDPKKALAEWAVAVGNKTIATLPAPPTVPESGQVYMRSLQFDADQAKRFGYLQQAPDVREIVDNELLEAAAAKLH